MFAGCKRVEGRGRKQKKKKDNSPNEKGEKEKDNTSVVSISPRCIGSEKNLNVSYFTSLLARSQWSISLLCYIANKTKQTHQTSRGAGCY